MAGLIADLMPALAKIELEKLIQPLFRVGANVFL